MNIVQHNPQDAWDLLFPKHLSMLSEINQDTMARAIKNSTFVWIGDVDGEIFGYWGLIPPTLLSDKAYLWFMHTEGLARCQFRLVRHSRKVTTELLSHYPVLVGHGRANDAKSLNWLRWCGASFSEPQGDLISFEIRAS